jgi:hypothetical protein
VVWECRCRKGRNVSFASLSLSFYLLGYSPPIFGLDLSPILAFFLLNVLTNATAALGAELTPEMKMTSQLKSYAPFAVKQIVNTKINDKLQRTRTFATLSDLEHERS